MGGTAQRLRLRLFLEGVEVPVIAASVQVMPNAPAACTIQIPPLPEGTRLFPRTLVHVFTLDFYEVQSPLLQDAPTAQALVSKGKVTPTMYERSVLRGIDKEGGTSGEFIDDTAVPDYRNQHYKLLFGGEIVGFAWTKTASNRCLVLHCLDWSNYWDYAYQWNNTDLFGPGVKALFSGGSTNLFTDLLGDESMAILRIIQSPSVQFPALQGLLGGIVHLLEAIGGNYYAGKRFAGQNIFFSIAELRLHITQLITAYEKDPTAKNLIQGDSFNNLFGRKLGGLGSQVSIRQAINALMSMIFHETYAIPTPLYAPGTDGTVAGVTRRSVRDDPAISFISVVADTLIRSIQSVKTELGGKTNGEIPPRILQSVLLTHIADMITLAKNTSARIRGKEVEAAKGFYGTALTALRKAKGLAQQWRPDGAKRTSDAITAALDEASNRLHRAANMEILSRKKRSVPARLNQQIFRPDVWFSAPPRCNVLFPEHYTQLDYQRSFLQEPTRLLLKTNSEFVGEDMLFDSFYFAPKGTTLKSQRRDLQAVLGNDILHHELFTGIMPVFEKMGELNIFAARSGTVQGRMPKIGLAQRSTNFLYFKYRFAARQMHVSGRFNPYIAPGFPGLVIDKYVDFETTARRQQLIDQYGGTSTEINKLLGTHFLANFTEVVHTVDQQQGRTDIICSYPRQPEESTEFFGVIEPAQKVRKRFNTDALRTTVVAALNPPKRSSLGPNYGNIVSVVEVTDAYRAKAFDDGGQLLPFYQGLRRTGTSEARIRVPCGLTATVAEYGSDVLDFFGNPAQVITFRAFEVKEEVPRYRRTVVDLPAEEYIRPGWYGDCWNSATIGKVYQQFFQTGSITDEQQVTDASGGSVGLQNGRAVDALAGALKGRLYDEPRTTAPALLTLDRDSSIDQSVAFLVQTYSYVRQSGVDVEDFLRTYTWRPIASMVDMFGTSDLMLSEDGETVLQGIEGFHSRAFGPYEDLFGLVTGDIETVLGLGRASRGAKQGDTRKRKRDAVLEYVAALQFARAVLG